jgi:hypothetical protein
MFASLERLITLSTVCFSDLRAFLIHFLSAHENGNETNNDSVWQIL